MSLREVWQDPVWGNVIAAVISTPIVGVMLLIPKSSRRFLKRNIERLRIKWRFSGFLGLTASNFTNIRVLSFQASGKNRSAKPIHDFRGHVESVITNKRFPLFLGIKGDLCKPEDTNGIPGKAWFNISAPLYEYHGGKALSSDKALTVEEFFSEIGTFVLRVEFDGTSVEKTFSSSASRRLVTRFQQSLIRSRASEPRVTRRVSS